MSLPGLQLSAPVETQVVPTVHDLTEGTEWRFEVAFGTRVEVRVCVFSIEDRSHSAFLANASLYSFSRAMRSYLAPNSRRNNLTYFRA